MNGGDLTRSTFRAHRHYSGVRMQQGRVQLDADWNEQLDLEAHRDYDEAVDVIGPAGFPKVSGGFRLIMSPEGDDLLVSPGRAWVGGHLVEADGESTAVVDLPTATSVTLATVVLDGSEIGALEWIQLYSDDDPDPQVARTTAVDVTQSTLTLDREVTAPTGDARLRRLASYAVQPDLYEPELTAQANPSVARVLALPDGDYLAYLDVWERAITALDDPSLIEPALGGPDTTTRSRIVWQVRLLDVSDLSPVDCDTNLSAALESLAPPSGQMAARAEPPAGSADLCRPTPAGGYIGLENQLYRVHVHDVDAGRPVIVWSRENASIVTTWVSANSNVLEVASIGPDAVLGFKPGDWVELFDDTSVLTGIPGTLVRLLTASGTQLKVDAATATGPLDLASYPRNPRVRRWDSPGAVPATTDDWIELENGVQVRFREGGTFRRHDYWLVPARSTTADVDWPQDSSGRALDQPPAGVRHSAGRLAVISVSGPTMSVTDCRDEFPALTALTADDVTVDNGVCSLPGVETVQDAIDALCRANDLRRHNRLLHGYGIVCGLAVHCGDRTDEDLRRDRLRRLPGTKLVPRKLEVGLEEEEGERRFVTVEPGSAIDSEGNDIDISEPVVVDVLERAKKLLDNKDGEVSLVLRTDPDAGPLIDVTPFEPQDDLSWLDGTLLWDIYDDCIADLLRWIKTRLNPSENATFEESQDAFLLRTALTNLASYAVNPKSGGNVFVSKHEDELLREFYEGLKKRLRSQTFCAMFDDARDFPNYPDSLRGMTTISGLGWHSRVRVHPSGEEAFTVGSGVNPTKPSTLINRYNLANETLVSRIDPVSGKELKPGDKAASTTGAVTDVAFSPDGRLMYATVPTRDENDTLFCTADIVAGTIRWRSATTICGVKLVTLATTAADPDSVYAVALRRRTSDSKGWSPAEYEGAGIFKITPGSIPDDLGPLPQTAALNTVGHLAITDGGVAVFTCGTPGSSAASYNELVSMSVPNGQVISSVKIDAGKDDIALATESRSGSVQVWAIVGTSDTRSIVGFEASQLGQVSDRIPLDFNGGGIALQAVVNRLVLTDTNMSTARVFELGKGFVDGLQLPLQVSPVSVSANRRPKNVVALNLVSNSLSVIDAELVRGGAFDLLPLQTYRTGVVDAFADLLYGFIQYLKDCICDHLLVDCPTIPENKDLDLAAVSIRKGSVYKVCNFSRRRYVKSFPTVGYWLSLVPIIPALRQVVTQVCCAVLQDTGLGVYKAADHADDDDRLSGQAILKLLEVAQAEDPISQLRNGQKTLRTVSKLAADGLWGDASDKVRETFQSPSSGKATAASDDLAELRKRLDSVEKELASLKSTKRGTTTKKT